MTAGVGTTRPAPPLSQPSTAAASSTVGVWLFPALWVAVYLLFPSWALPGPRSRSFAALFALIVFFALNGWLVYRWRGLLNLRHARDPHDAGAPWWSNRRLLAVLVTLAVLQIYPLAAPPLGVPGDETSLALTGPNLLSPLWRIAARLHVGVGLLRLAVIVLAACAAGAVWVLWRKARASRRSAHAPGRRDGLWIALAVAAFVVAMLAWCWVVTRLFSANGVVDPPYTFHREPPLSRYVLSASTLLFGATELAARLPQLLFALLAVAYLYRTVRLFRDEPVAIVAALIFGLLPPVFYYAHQAYLESGLLLLTIAAAFHYLRHLRLGDARDVITGTLLTSAAFVYKRPGILMAAVLGLTVVLLCVRQRRWAAPLAWQEYAKVAWLCLASALPWLILVGRYAGPGRFIRYKYTPNFANLRSFTIATEYLRQMPLQLGWVLLALLAASLIVIAARRRDLLTIFCVLWVAVFYVFFTLDDWRECIGYDRFAIVWFAPFAIWVADALAGWRSMRRVSWAAGLAAAAFLAFGDTVVRVGPLSPQYASWLDVSGHLPPASPTWAKSVNSFGTGSVYLPFGGVLKDIRQRGDTARLLTWDNQSLQYYAFKTGEAPPLFQCSEGLPNCQFSTPRQLSAFAQANGIGLVLLPAGRDYTGAPLGGDYLGPALVHALAVGNVPGFAVVGEERRGDYALMLLRPVGGSALRAPGGT